MTNDRALAYMHSTKSAMTKTELQIMSKLRYFYGSEEPNAAATAQTLSMLIERKVQSFTNLNVTQQYLSSTDSTIASANTLAIDAKTSALDALNVTTSATQRNALAQTVSEGINQLFKLGNAQFLDRYLFSGSTTSTRPFEWSLNSYSVVYRGSVANIYSWTNVDSLTQSNMNGSDVFGAISAPVKGLDLNPGIKNSTLLSTLNNGQGIESGAIRLNYTDPGGKTTSVNIDLSACVTVEDIRTQISGYAPIGADISLDTTDFGLSVSLGKSSGGSLTISDIGSGKTAKTLGIATKQPISAGSTFVGVDLNPALTLSSSLDDVLGTRARTSLKFAGGNNDIVFTANYNGSEYTDGDGNVWSLNGIEFAVVSDSKTAAGSEWVEYDESTNRVTIHIHPNDTNASGIIKAVNEAATAGTIPPVTASIDSQDISKTDGGFVPLLPGTTVVSEKTKYGTGESLDKSSGIQIYNDNIVHTVTLDDCRNVDDFLNKLNDPSLGLYASINSMKNGINISSRVSGTDFMIGENGGSTATQLGLRTLTGDTFLSELDFNRGVQDYEGPGTNASSGYMLTYENAGMILTAKEEGPDWNDYKINFVPTTDPEGNVTISWDEDAKIVNIGIVSGTTRACEVVTAFAQQPGPNAAFTLELDTSGGINTGQGVVYDGLMTTEGGAYGGIDFTITRADGVSFDVDINGAKTIQDILDIINNHSGNTGGLIEARLVPYGNGIELIDHSIGSGNTVVERSLLSTAAIDLGLIPYGQEFQSQTDPGEKATLSLESSAMQSSLIFSDRYAGEYGNEVKVEFLDMNRAGGSGRTGFYYDANSKTLMFEIDPGTTTAQDVIDLFNDNATLAVKDMFTIQNGVNSDGTTSDGSGLVDLTSTDPAEIPRLSGGTNGILNGTDPNPLETESLFTAFIRLQAALEANDEREIERAAALLEKTMQTADDARSVVGARQQSLDSLLILLEDEGVQLTEALKAAQGTDLTDAAIRLGSQESAYESTLALAGKMFSMSLANYL